MSEKLIRSINELPNWYELNKYQNLKLLDSASWYEILLQRWTHEYFIKSEGIHKYKKQKENGQENEFYSVLLESRKDPLFLMDDIQQIYLIGGGKLAELKLSPHSYSNLMHGVSPATYRRIYQYENKMSREVLYKVRDWFDSFFDSSKEYDYSDAFKKKSDWAKSFVDKPIFDALDKVGKKSNINEKLYSRSSELVEINLMLPDKILEQQFSEYLKVARHDRIYSRTPFSYKRPEYSKWIEYSVLPFIDLNLWALENNIKIPNRVMADAIFRDYEKGEEVVRKTTSKIAKTIVQENYIDFFSTIVANDLMEKK